MILKLFYFLAITVKCSGSYCSLVVPIIFSSNSSMVVHKAQILQIYIYIYMWLTLGCMQFSLPLPRGGRDAITKNPILREDQLPHKLLHPKTKKKANKPVSFIPFSSPFF